MIYDSMRAFQKYKGISPETWSKITGFLDSVSGTIPEASSTRLDGDKLIANVVHTNTPVSTAASMKATAAMSISISRCAVRRPSSAAVTVATSSRSALSMKPMITSSLKQHPASRSHLNRDIFSFSTPANLTMSSMATVLPSSR